MPDWVGGTYYNRCDQRDFSVQVGPPEHAMKEEPYKYFYRLASGYTILSRNHRSEYVVTDYSPSATEPRIGEYNPPVKADDLKTITDRGNRTAVYVYVENVFRGIKIRDHDLEIEWFFGSFSVGSEYYGKYMSIR